MATVIDRLVVEFGLDPSNFTKGQKQLVADLKTTEDQATKTGKEMEARGKQAAQFFGQIRDQVIGLFAAFTAGEGIKSFAERTNAADAAAGRLAKNVGVAVGELTAWEGVARRSGASAEDVDSSFTSLTQQFQQFALTGNSAVIPYFRALGISVADSSGKMRPMNDILLDLADRFKGMDPAKAQAFGAGLGLTPGMVNTLMQGRDALRAMFAEQEKIGHANAGDVAAAQKLQTAFRGLSDASSDLGRKIMTAVTPGLLALSSALAKLMQWAAQHPRVVQAFVAVTAAVVAAAIAFFALSSPILAATAAVAAMAAGVALLYDDWKSWTEGGKSLFSGFWQTVTDYWKLLVALFTGSPEEIEAAWDKLFGDLKDAFTGFIDFVANSGPALLAAFKSGFGAAWGWLEGRWNAFKGLFGFGGGSAAPAPGGAPAGVAPAPAPAGGPRVSGSPVPAPGTLSGSDVDKLVALGWTRAQATGIVANLSRESGGNAQAVGDNGQAFGLAQWHPDRQAAFKAWAGHDIRGSSRDEQLGFIDYELRQGTERKAGAALAQTKDAGEAARTFSKLYERPAHGEEEATLRANLALGAAGSRLAAGAGSSASTSTSRTDVTIGTVNVNAPNATDSDGVAKGINKSIKRYGFLPAADSGLS